MASSKTVLLRTVLTAYLYDRHAGGIRLIRKLLVCLSKCVFKHIQTYKFQSFKAYFNNIPEGHRPMWIYTMYAGMSTGKYNDT